MSSDFAKRHAVTLTFFVHGLAFGSWVTRIPEVKMRLAINEAQLGLLLLGLSAGLIVTILFTGGVIDRFSSKKVTYISTLLQATLLLVLGIAPTYLLMWISLFLFGSAMTMMDVAMNANAVEVERQFGSSIMSSFHAAYSIGGFTGAALGGFLINLQFTALNHFLIIIFLIFSIATFVQRFYVEDRMDENKEEVPVFAIPPKALWPLGIIGLLSSIGEGTLGDWTGLYLIEYFDVGESRAAWGFAAFSLAMTTGRLVGDKLTDRLNRITVLRISGSLSFIGIIILLFSPSYVIALFAIGIAGLGLSVIVPIVFTTAGNMPGYQSGVGIASVASIGYLGFLVGPPVIGFIAELFSLAISFSLVAILMIAVILLSPHAEITE